MKRVLVAVLIFALPVVIRCGNGGGTSDRGVDATSPTDAQADVVAIDAADAGDAAPDAPACGPNNPCADDASTCCSSICTNLKKDPKNCGACGTACGAQQFCNGQACFDAIVANLCHNASAAVVLDGLPPDDDASVTIGGAIDGGCVPAVVVRQIVQGAPGSIDDAGRPLLGPGDTYVAAGGGFGQNEVAYMGSTFEAPVYVTGDANSISFNKSSDKTLIVQAQNTVLTAHHDYFVAYTAVEPVSGTLVFNVYGFYAPGTAAGAYWFRTQVAPSVGTFTKAFYVYEWTDTDSDGLPSAGDTFTLVASG
ncbi:MAG TPA: hypothetical protein VGH28_21715 [Polyangiaceae bacterium]|jgi:hypothetical protein